MQKDNNSSIENENYSTSEANEKNNESNSSACSHKKSKEKQINDLLLEDDVYDNPKHHLNSAEKTFVNNIQLCLNTNGSVAPTELYVLDKIRIALNISPNRAKELYTSILNEYNTNKVESLYKDAVSLCLLDGNYITKSERRLLSTLKDTLNLSDSKAYEIEENCKW